MKILDSFHRETRITGGTIDTGLYRSLNDETDAVMAPYIQYPIHYWVKVQIRIMRLFWITVWSATVKFEDEAVDAVNARAKVVADTISCTGL